MKLIQKATKSGRERDVSQSSRANKDIVTCYPKPVGDRFKHRDK